MFANDGPVLPDVAERAERSLRARTLNVKDADRRRRL
jgi:hypothetical protein